MAHTPAVVLAQLLMDLGTELQRTTALTRRCVHSAHLAHHPAHDQVERNERVTDRLVDYLRDLP